jgi:hypothetical protein
LGEGLQKNVLGCFLNQTALPEKSTGNLEHSGTVASDDLGEGRLISGACLTRQVEVRGLFEAAGQKRSSSKFTDGGLVMN